MTSSGPANALVTGGTRGIGLGIARALARDGWDLVLGGVRPDRASRAGRSTSSKPRAPTVHYVAGRSRAPRRSRAAGRRSADALRRVNALVNNAGRAPRVSADLLEATEDSFEELIRDQPAGRRIS